MSKASQYPICGSLECFDCREKTTKLIENYVPRFLWPGKAPTQEELDRHIRIYGTECVKEISDFYGLKMPRPSRGKDTKELVKNLTKSGWSEGAIAYELSVSTKTVRNYRSKMEDL